MYACVVIWISPVVYTGWLAETEVTMLGVPSGGEERQMRRFLK